MACNYNSKGNISWFFKKVCRGKQLCGGKNICTLYDFNSFEKNTCLNCQIYKSSLLI